MNISFAQLIKIDRRKSDAVYLQIVYQFIQAIQQGILKEGQQLPGSRIISKELNVHRKTVVAALEELKMQGWIETRASVGTFVKNLHLRNKNTFNKREAVDLKHADFGYRKSFILDAESYKNDCSYHFTDGTPDYRIIKMYELSRYYTSALKRKNVIKKISENPLKNNSYFLEQLSYYLNLTRGFHISTKNMMLTGTRQSLLYILSQLLLRKDDMVLVGAYSYYLSNMIFQQSGADIHTVPVDDEGIKVAHIASHYKPGQIRVLYLQTQHQYPTTCCLSEERKDQLLKLSKEYGFIIIEDDFSYELSYGPSANSLFKKSPINNCIYIGEFGKYLPPGFQNGILLGPEDFILESKKYLNLFGTSDMVKEQALAEMIYEGHIHRYKRKVLKIYENRRDAFNELLQHYFGEAITYQIPSGGLAFWISFKHPLSLIALAKNAGKLGLHIPAICLYQNKSTCALRIGFAHLDREEMDKAMALFYKAYQTTIQANQSQC